MSDSFPRQYARTQRLTLGEPRDLTVSPDGDRVVFARSGAGDDPVNRLWVADVSTGDEALLADPVELLTQLTADDTDLPDEERARRERMREGAGGITAYATDDSVGLCAFALGGHLFACETGARRAWHVPVAGPVFDPRPAPTGDRIAFVRGSEVWATDLSGVAHPVVAEQPPSVEIGWGSADFIAAEEMNRYRGFWWSPDGTKLAVCRVDDGPVQTWHIADAAEPGRPPRPIRYPAAGTANPDVTLYVCPVEGGEPVEVGWDRIAFPYLAKVDWNEHGLAITVQSRDQRDLQIAVVDPDDGAATTIWSDHDEAWIELVPGAGRLIGDGIAVTCADRGGVRRLVVVGGPAGLDVVSPPDVQVRSIVAASPDRVLVTGNPIDDATVQHLYRWSSGGFEVLTTEPGTHAGVAGGDTVIVRTATLDEPDARWHLPSGHVLTSHAERPLVRPNVALTIHTRTTPATAVLLPDGHDGSPLPVLLDPYGGPHAQRVVRSHHAFCTAQWFADQGFAVVVADGRGTPGRGSAYERSIAGDLASGVLDDQVVALHAAAERHPELDLGRVAIRGWSFGGYLAALAVLRRPEVFHVAIAGAPVTEWRLYDTHYTERYLGDPNRSPEVYDASSLLPLAPSLTRPLLLIHGLADDNVVAAHTLRLSSALLAAGRPHEVLPLVGVTHMTPQEVVAEHLLVHQLEFLRRSLPMATPA